MHGSLAHALREAASIQSEWSPDALAEVEARLVEAEQSARAAYPEVSVPAERWLRHVATKVTSFEEPGRALDGLHLDELYLVAGCLTRDPAALDAFDRRYMGGVAAVVAKLGVDADARDEVTQELRGHLLVARDDAQPKLAGYSGRGSLAGWLKVIATRTALRRKRRRRPDAPLDSLLLERVADSPPDPELDHVKRRYQREFAAALEHAFRQLRAEQRTLLRMYVTDGATLGELAALHDVNASTVSRWLSHIRETLFDVAREHLTEQLHLRPSEYESLNKALRSGLHVSVERLLAEGGSSEHP